MRLSRKVMTAAAALSLLVAATVVLVATRKAHDDTDLRLDVSVRRAVSGIVASQVDVIKVTGAPGVIREPITIHDEALVSEVLSGLRQSRVRKLQTPCLTEQLTIVLKDGRRIGPLSFSASSEVDCFHPQVASALRQAGVDVPHR